VKSKKKIIIGVSVLFLFTLLLMIVFGDNGFLDLKRLKKERATLAEQSCDMESQNLKLYRKVERLKNDPVFIENVARQELGMIGEDEVILKFKKK
jgi:cell division protein FtsB